MSATAGVILNASDAAHDMVLTLLSAMPYRAPDGTQVWSDGHVALGLGYMRTLPEDPVAATVFCEGEVRLVADARLDNRPELMAELGIEGHDLSEGELILAAYRRWGTDCPQHLLGDFAVIIYDGEHRRLFAIRDHMGVKPLFYRFGSEGVALASELKVLVAPAGPFGDLSQAGMIDQQIGDFMTGQLPEDNQVLYAGLMRLPSGHVLISDNGQAPVVTQYWQPAPLPADILTDKSPQALRDLLTEAVRCRLRSVAPVAALLSGGLDSTAIACLASQLQTETCQGPVDSFSIVFDKTPHLSERDYIEAGIAGGEFTPRFVAMDGYAPFEGFENLLQLEGRLFGAPGLKMTSALFDRVGQEGFRVVLDGHGGDEVLSHGYGRLHELARAGRWRKLWRETQAYSGLYGGNRVGLYALLVIRYGRFKGSHSLRRLAAVAQRHWPQSDRGQLLAPAFKAKGLPVADRVSHQDEASQHIAFLRSAGLASSLEILEVAAAGAGLEPRFAFFDKRVVEFCLSLPSEAKLDDGWIRLILRRAMEGVLPPKVQWRRSKFDFAPHIAYGLMTHHDALLSEVIERDIDGVSAYVDLGRVQPALKRLRRKGYKTAAHDLQSVWRTVALSLWLRQNHGKTRSN